MGSTGNTGLDALADAIAERVYAKLVAEREREGKRLFTIVEAAAYLKRSERWVRGEIAAGRLECVREGNGRARLDRTVLDRWIEQRAGRVA